MGRNLVIDHIINQEGHWFYLRRDAVSYFWESNCYKSTITFVWSTPIQASMVLHGTWWSQATKAMSLTSEDLMESGKWSKYWAFVVKSKRGDGLSRLGNLNEVPKNSSLEVYNLNSLFQNVCKNFH